jgi:hypothetical protein
VAEEEVVMFDDEKLAADQEILDDHNVDQGWAVHGPQVQPKPKAPAVSEKAGPAPGVLQVDSAEPHVLVDGIASAVGQVASEVPAGVVLDLGGRPLNILANESTNPRVRQAIERMAACREQYKNLRPEQLAEEDADINRRLSQKYRTECQLPASGGTVSKSATTTRRPSSGSTWISSRCCSSRTCRVRRSSRSAVSRIPRTSVRPSSTSWTRT